MITCDLWNLFVAYNACPKRDTGIRRAEVVGKRGLVWSTTFYIEITDSVHGNGKRTKLAFRGRRELAAFRPFLFVSPLANEPINTQRFEAGVWLARTRLNNRKGIAKDFCSDVPIIIEALSADNEHPCSVNINWTRATPFNVPLYTRW